MKCNLNTLRYSASVMFGLVSPSCYSTAVGMARRRLSRESSRLAKFLEPASYIVLGLALEHPSRYLELL